MPSNGCPVAHVEKNNALPRGFQAEGSNCAGNSRGRGVKALFRALLKFDRRHAVGRVAVGRTMMIGTRTVLARWPFVFARRFGAKVVFSVIGRDRIVFATGNLDSPVATIALRAAAVVMMPAAAKQSVRQDGSRHQAGQQTLQGGPSTECVE